MIKRPSKSVSVERERAAREFTQALVDRLFAGRVGDAAKAFGVAGPTLSEFLSGRRGPGVKMLEGVADCASVSIDRVLGRDVSEGPAASAGDPIVERRQAARFARENGLPEKAIIRVSRMTARPGLTPLQWFRRIEVAAEELTNDTGEQPVTPPDESGDRAPRSPRKRRA